jgi:hypothetical protein
VDDSLAAALAETDPRRAIIAAYLRMGGLLGAAGLPRHRWEAPYEHLDRVLVTLGASAAAATTLTALFEEAEFSQHPLGPSARDQAIAALSAVRHDLVGAT